MRLEYAAGLERESMACPYFYPIARHDAELWQHRRRLPLGDGFTGRCTAPGCDSALSNEQMGSCNMGYVTDCPNLPADRPADAVHFCVAADKDGLIQLSWVSVKDHAAAAHGSLDFDRASTQWVTTHPQETIQQMADCYLKTYFDKRGETPRP